MNKNKKMFRKGFIDGVTTLLLAEIDLIALTMLSYKFFEKLFM